ncbi:hypothetical protein IAU60_000273 [Kwoniella sp. DSM 27419]
MAGGEDLSPKKADDGGSEGESSAVEGIDNGSNGLESDMRDDVVMLDLQQEVEGAAERDGEGPIEGEEAMEEAGPVQEGKRVKVYELRDASWFDRGTGFCKGIYDDTRDLALLIVEREEVAEEGGKLEAPGGFLKDDLLLSARVEKEDIYGKQQDTLVVWTEPATGLDIALSFQDPEGCEDIWQFICEVQRHLMNMSADADATQIPSSSSPIGGSPVLGPASSQMQMMDPGAAWQVPTLANVRDQEMFIRMQAKSQTGRERAVEHILKEDYIKHLINVLEQAEDLESIEDLHALCSLMQTILLFNDNGIFEYILQDDVFMGVIGMMEYDPEFPGLKAAYRQFFQDTARFRQVVEIKDDNIRNKIHQTYRLLYLKDVVLARVLDDPTFNILNGVVFFNQVDIINYIQQNDSFLVQLFDGFRDAPPEDGVSKDEALDGRKRDVVMFLHQLMIMGKGVQVPGRLALYRNLVDRGLLFVCEWAFRRHEAQLLHAGAEILTLAVEHDANVVRLHVFKEDEAKRRTLVTEIIGLLHTTKNLGLISQMCDTLRTLLEIPQDFEIIARAKDGPLADSFGTHFYEHCATPLFKPLLDAPDIKAEIAKGNPAKLPREQNALLQNLIELLSFCVTNHAHRASYFVLSNPISKRVVGLLHVKDKPLRHAVLRYIRACLKSANHFIHRYFVKNELLLPLLDLLEEESRRDNMMSSACMEVLELIRKENIKMFISWLFRSCRDRMDRLAERPFPRAIINGLRSRWEINNEPPPVARVEPSEAESSKAIETRAAAAEEEYFNASDDEEESGAKAVEGTKGSGSPLAPQKRKRMFTHGGGPKKRPSGARAPGSAAGGASPAGGGALGLDYDDGSDSDSSTGGQSPRTPAEASGETALGESSTGPKDSSEGLDPEEAMQQLRARRKQKEEEDEEVFAGLLGKGGSNGKGAAASETAEAGTGEGASGKKPGTPVKEMGMGKKLKLNLGGLGKKLGGGGK